MEIQNFLSEKDVVNYLIKIFSLVISLLYFIYSLIINKQTKIMLKTVSLDSKNFILTVSYFQVLCGILLILLALIII